MKHYITTIMALLLLVACQGKEEGMVDAIQPGMTLHVPLAKAARYTRLNNSLLIPLSVGNQQSSIRKRMVRW